VSSAGAWDGGTNGRNSGRSLVSRAGAVVAIEIRR
jgi:hypothetical protein